jgi:cyclopropane-fatty-acyl-phospholipid synthase
MATKHDIDFTYSTIDKIHRLALGETADLSGAKYNGNFSLTVEQAQRAKHQFIADQLNIRTGNRVLDMGCGWGPILKFMKEIGAKATGLTLSDGQYQTCRKNGFDVHIKDVRTVAPGDFGIFDAVISVGAFEHFCSFEEYMAGKQEIIYRDFFETVYNLLPPGGRFFLQTMTFTDKMHDFQAADIHANKKSNEYIIALTIKLFPGSWLPYGPEMIIRNAESFFKLINSESGRSDYIETIMQWRKMFRRFNLKKYALYFRFIFECIMNKNFRHLIQVFRINPIRVCFERDLMDHYRIVFEKK